MVLLERTNKSYIGAARRCIPANYDPLEVVLSSGRGCWVWDIEGNKYLDLLSAYSALNLGHSHPRLVKVLREQSDVLTVTGRAVYTEEMILAAQEVASLCNRDACIFMNSGAEAVETALKAARRWGYQKKGIARDAANVIVFSGNFHGRTTTVTGFSDSETSRCNFGPFTPGFRLASYGVIEDVIAQLDETVVAVLFEPIQGEAGVIFPPSGFLNALRELCTEHNVLLIADEIQTGFGRAGEMLVSQASGCEADVFLLGKTLGGGILPVSAVVADWEVLDVFTPGSHGGTFTGNPLAARIAREVLAIFQEEEMCAKSRSLGTYFMSLLEPAVSSAAVKNLRGQGLFIALDLEPRYTSGKEFCRRMLQRGILCKETNGQTVRLTPPLVVTKEELAWCAQEVIRDLSQ